MATVHFTARVQGTRILELPEEAVELGLLPGDEVEVSIAAPASKPLQSEILSVGTAEERAKAFRAWAAGHSHTSSLLSDEAIARETIYEGRG